MKSHGYPKRVLCIIGSMDAGGAETFLMKVYRKLDKEKYQMDFLVSNSKVGFYDEEIISNGGKIFKSVPKTRSPIKSFLNLKRIVKDEEYRSVIRVSQHSISTFDLLAALLGGADKLIYRSSNTKTGTGKLNSLLHILFKWLPRTIPTVKIAPSTEAAEFMFGKNSVKKGKINIIKNAIDIEQFIFDENKRVTVRAEFEIEDKYVVGHVGRFNQQKNHSFLIDIFNEIYKKNNNSILILVGKGELENEIKRKIETLGLVEQVIFTGVRSDVADIMMAMDIFIFPSFFEGLPNTVIEAQATGLRCIISNKITKEAKITTLVKFKSIESDPLEWAEDKLVEENNDIRKNMKKEFIDNGYNIEVVARKFEELIF